MFSHHSFHIPVMGSGFTIDTAIKVSQYGIDSVLSLVDDILMEKLRKYYCDLNGYEYSEIDRSKKELRAERITAYLNLLDSISLNRFRELQKNVMNDPDIAIAFFKTFPEDSEIKNKGNWFLNQNKHGSREYCDWVMSAMKRGSIDANIMTKLDRQNYNSNGSLPTEYKDAHAAVRGFANSTLQSALVLSAGLSPELYGYISEFKCFNLRDDGTFDKRIVVKVSDFRSAMIQGKFLAKKGIFVSEFRIESGLNCGGHTFASEGHLFGPILAEFRDKRSELEKSIGEIYTKAISDSGRPVPKELPRIRITAQGGVGSHEEHDFLLSFYKVNSVGWGTPFLLVPEVVNVDQFSLDLICSAGENDVLLSKNSPLEIPFYIVKGNSRDIEKEKRIAEGRPGVKCPRKYLALNKEFSDQGLCMASYEYQKQKLKALQNSGLTEDEIAEKSEYIMSKTCICVGLGTSVLMNYGIDSDEEGPGAAICPSPNIAYFSKVSSLNEMTDHIYGRKSLVTDPERPNMFIKELDTNIRYLREMLDDTRGSTNKKHFKYLQIYAENVRSGILYYDELFRSIKSFVNEKGKILGYLSDARTVIDNLSKEIESLIIVA